MLGQQGLFFAIAVITHGVRRFRAEQLNHEDSDIRIGRWWDVLITVLVPVQAVVLMVWWLWQARASNPEGWLDPIATFNVGTVLVQFAVVFAVLLLANRWLARRSAP